MSQRDISKTIEDIYGFSISHEMVSDITDVILPELEERRNRPLKKCYAFLFIDGMYVTLRNGYEAKECVVYTILGYDLNGYKDILGYGLVKVRVRIIGCRYLMNESTRIRRCFLYVDGWG